MIADRLNSNNRFIARIIKYELHDKIIIKYISGHTFFNHGQHHKGTDQNPLKGIGN
jgi:transposase